MEWAPPILKILENHNSDFAVAQHEIFRSKNSWPEGKSSGHMGSIYIKSAEFMFRNPARRRAEIKQVGGQKYDYLLMVQLK